MHDKKFYAHLLENPSENTVLVLDVDDYEGIFREMELTRQQSLVAALLSLKHPDAEICSSLNISPNTLKTHIRNILKKLSIRSRHELAWLAKKFSEEKAL